VPVLHTRSSPWLTVPVVHVNELQLGFNTQQSSESQVCPRHFKPPGDAISAELAGQSPLEKEAHVGLSEQHSFTVQGSVAHLVTLPPPLEGLNAPEPHKFDEASAQFVMQQSAAAQFSPSQTLPVSPAS